jgi:quercetin dioxygenase-like cupin family protein
VTFPRIPTLLLLALAASAFASEPPPEPGLPHAFDAGWQGRETCELLYETEQVRVGHCVFPPGVGHEKHYHEPHFGYVLEGGTLRITDATGTRETTTRTGADWATATRTVHEALNIGDTTTSYLVVEPR